MNGFKFLFGFLLIACLLACEDTGTNQNGGDEEAQTCTTDTECSGISGAWCSPSSGTCISACTSSADCLDDKICDRTTRQCLECLYDSHCEGYCDLDTNTCQPPCTSEDDCDTGEYCVSGRCQTEPAPVDGDDDGDIEPEEGFVAECPLDLDGKCEPGCTTCDSKFVSTTCRESGEGFDQKTCQADEFCHPETGECGPLLCEGGTSECLEDRAAIKTCYLDGTDYDIEECPANWACADAVCYVPACEQEREPLAFNFELNSEIAAPDRYCSTSVNLGNAVLRTDNKYDTGLSFNGLEQRAYILDNFGSYSRTLSLAVNIKPEWDAPDSGKEILLTKGDAPDFQLSIEQGKVVFRLGDALGDQQFIQGEQTLARDKWTHVAIIFDNGNLTLYIDGEKDGDTKEVMAFLQESEAPIVLGGSLDDENALQYPFKGMLDNLYLSPNGLDENDLAYLAGAEHLCVPLESYEIRELACENLCNRQLMMIPAISDWTVTDISLLPKQSFLLDPGGCPDNGTTSICYSPAGKLGETCGPDCLVSSALRYSLVLRYSVIDYPGRYAGKRGVYSYDKPGTIQFAFNDSAGGYSESFIGAIVERGYCPTNRCPENMVPIPGHRVCIDRYEASCNDATFRENPCLDGEEEYENEAAQSLPGKIPWYDLTPDDAAAACERAEKRLCTLEEWVAACEGDPATDFPYGDTEMDNICNDGRYSLNDPAKLMPTGYLNQCISQNGVYDLSGNVAEFTSTIQGVSGHATMGGTYSDYQSRCQNQTQTFDRSEKFGFRCCADTVFPPETLQAD